MTQTDLSTDLRPVSAGSISKKRALPVWVLAIPGAGALAVAFFQPDVPLRLSLEVFGWVLLASAAFVSVKSLATRNAQRATRKTISSMIEHDSEPCLLSDSSGNIIEANGAADERFRKHAVDTLGFAFTELFANPGAVIFRVQSKAHALGAAREEIVTRRGHLRLSVTMVSDDRFLWRLEDLSEKGGGARAADALSLPMLTAGPTGTILYMNDAFRRLLGGRAKNLDGVFADAPLVTGQVHKVRAAGGVVESLVAEIPSHGGRREVYLLPGESTEIPEIGLSSPPQWDAIDELPVPLLKIATNGAILSSNREARMLLDREIDGELRMADLFEGLGRPLVDWLEEAAAGKGAMKPEFLKATGPKSEQFIQVSLNPAGDANTPYLLAVLNDVTEFKSLELQFVQSQKMQAIGQLAGGVAHDFNNLLTAISGHCDLLLLRHDQGDQDYADLVQIHQNANRAAAVVGQLLAYSRKQTLKPEVIDLRNALGETTHLLNRLVGEKVTLTINHDPGLDPIRVDGRQLEQVVMNLVVNSRDAMPEGGEIQIVTENMTLSEPLKRDRATVPAGRYVCLSVRDTGTGIAPEVLSTMFEPFVTTKKLGEGTGLGLSTAYGIIKQTGGYIFADSALGEGTVFSIFIPAHDGPLDVPEKAHVIDPVLPAGQADGVVLLVEDEAPVRAFASRALRMRGYTVLEAESAEAALDLLQDEEMTVDLFVTDVIMPGMDGPTWVRKALKERPDARVIFVSGYAEETFGEDQKEIPNSLFLPKPFSLTELTRTVQKQLH